MLRIQSLQKCYSMLHVNWSVVGEQPYLKTYWNPCWPNPTSFALFFSLFLEKHGDRNIFNTV